MRDLDKSALVIAPYAFDFEPYDSAFDVQEALAALPDYLGRVTTVSNDTDVITDRIPMSTYTSWNDYDVIFFSTHGDASPVEPAGPILWLGHRVDDCDSASAQIRVGEDGLADEQVEGIACNLVSVRSGAGKRWVTDIGILPGFFEKNYPDGLDRKVIVLEACRPGFNDRMVQALVGEDTIVLAWDEYVGVKFSQLVLVRLFEQAAGFGFPIWRSFLRTCLDGSCVEPLEDGEHGPYDGEKPAELLIAHSRADLRIRDALTALPPFTTLNCSAPVPPLTVAQTCPTCVGEDVPALVSYGVVAKGFEAEDLVLHQDPVEFALKTPRLFADADGVETGFAFPVTDQLATPLGDGAWQQSIALGLEGVCPGQIVSYDPKLMLPAFDPDQPGNEARDFLYDWDGPFDVVVGP